MTEEQAYQANLMEDDVAQPLTKLKHRLDASHIDVKETDHSCTATIVRMTTSCVVHLFTPRQILGFLRLLKAVTFCFLILSIIADAMYIIFLEIMATGSVRRMAGGSRDLILRLYGLALAIFAIAIELDVRGVVKKLSGLKGFIARGFLLFFVAVLTGSHPSNQWEYGAAFFQGDDDDSYSQYANAQIAAEIPSSAIGFQLVTSVIL